MRRVGIAHRVGQAHALGAGIEHRLHQAHHLVGSTRPWIVQPKAVLMPTSISVREPAASRAARMRRDLGDHFVGRLAQVGQAVRVAGRQRHQHQRRPRSSMRALGAFQVGHQHRRDQAGQGLGEGQHLGRVRQLRQQARAARRSRPRSRAGRPRRRRGAIRAWRPSARRAAMLCRPSRRPDLADRRRGAAGSCWIVISLLGLHWRSKSRISNRDDLRQFGNADSSESGISDCATSTSPLCACSSPSARPGNIARAGERANIVGSAISKRLAQLEDQVGTPLLMRKRHGVVPTRRRADLAGTRARHARQRRAHRARHAELTSPATRPGAHPGVASRP